MSDPGTDDDDLGPVTSFHRHLRTDKARSLPGVSRVFIHWSGQWTDDQFPRSKVEGGKGGIVAYLVIASDRLDFYT